MVVQRQRAVSFGVSRIPPKQQVIVWPGRRRSYAGGLLGPPAPAIAGAGASLQAARRANVSRCVEALNQALGNDPRHQLVDVELLLSLEGVIHRTLRTYVAHPAHT
jgi:hypothetical protein